MPQRDGTTTLLLCAFLGNLGAHRFYVGRLGSGIAMLLTLGGLGVWATVDLIHLCTGKFTDAEGNVIELNRGTPPPPGDRRAA